MYLIQMIFHGRRKESTKIKLRPQLDFNEMEKKTSRKESSHKKGTAVKKNHCIF